MGSVYLQSASLDIAAASHNGSREKKSANNKPYLAQFTVALIRFFPPSLA